MMMMKNSLQIPLLRTLRLLVHPPQNTFFVTARNYSWKSQFLASVLFYLKPALVDPRQLIA